MTDTASTPSQSAQSAQTAQPSQFMTVGRRAVALAAGALVLASLTGCTVRARGGHARHHGPPPPPTTQPAPAVAPGVAPAPTPAGQAARQAQLLGERQVTFRAEKDTIAAAHQGRFRKIRMHVSGSPLEMYNVKVTFGDGSSFSPQTRLVFAQGAWSRVIDLPGNARRIRKVEFWYRSRGARTGRARVQLFGI